MFVTNALTAGLLSVTAIYAFLTYKMLRTNENVVAQMKAQHDSLMAPSVSISIKVLKQSLLYLSIKNIGRYPAKALRLSLDRDFYALAEVGPGRNIRDQTAFKKVTPSLAPDEQLLFLLCQGFKVGELVNGLLVTPPEFIVTTEFESGGRTVIEHHSIDLRSYLGTTQDRDEVVDELEKLRKAVEKLGG